MAWLRLTRMVERKAKDGARGELRLFAYAGVAPCWVHTPHVAAVSTFRGTVYKEDWETEERDITELYLAGGGDPIPVLEAAAEVLAQLGLEGPIAPPAPPAPPAPSAPPTKKPGRRGKAKAD
jgi:hypothetical protein